jgi:hypothetical protein
VNHPRAFYISNVTNVYVRNVEIAVDLGEQGCLVEAFESRSGDSRELKSSLNLILLIAFRVSDICAWIASHLCRVLHYMLEGASVCRVTSRRSLLWRAPPGLVQPLHVMQQIPAPLHVSTLGFIKHRLPTAFRYHIVFDMSKIYHTTETRLLSNVERGNGT